MTEQNLSTLQINKLSQKQFDREEAAGRLDQSAWYLTPEEAPDKTLTVDGAAADAKATGDRLEIVESALLDIPTKTSELENDKGFITKADIPTDESYELIGETPLTLAEKSNIKLVADGETTYEAKTPTVWNFDDVFANGDYTLTKCTLEKEDDHYKIVSGDTVTAHYQSYVKLLIPVEAGKTYNLCFDVSASKKNTTDEPNDWSGQLIVYDGDTTSSSAILANSVIPDLKTAFEITPTANVLHIRYFPARANAQNKAGSIARFNSMWLNEGIETALTDIYNISGTMDGSIVLQKVPKGSTVTATPTAKIYTKAPTDKTLTKSDVPADAQATGERIEAVKNLLPLYGKTIVNFGDSIFGNAQPPVDISTHLANKTGATVYNCGFGGCRMTPHTMTEYDAFCMYNLADAITTRDFTKQNEAVARGNLAERYSAGLERLKSIDFSNVDIITIAYGTNDFNGYGATLDNAENPLDTSAFGGALRYSIEKLLTAYPNLRIFVLSTTWNFSMDSDGNYTEDSNTRINSGGQTIQQYNAKLKEVAEEYNLPFVDDYNIGINKFNRSQYFNTNDGAHHKETGRELIAEHLAGALIGGNHSWSNNVKAPTKTSELENDSGFITEAALPNINIDNIVEKQEPSINLYKPVPAEEWTNGMLGNPSADDYAYCIIPAECGKTYTAVGWIEAPISLVTRDDTEGVQLDPIPCFHFDPDYVNTFDTYVFTIPENCNYLALTIFKSNYDPAMDSDIGPIVDNFNSVFMLLEGDYSASETIPFYEPYSKEYKLKDNIEIPALPEVTEEDNGKVLMVVNGKWQVVNLNLTVDENGNLVV